MHVALTLQQSRPHPRDLCFPALRASSVVRHLNAPPPPPEPPWAWLGTSRDTATTVLPNQWACLVGVSSSEVRPLTRASVHYMCCLGPHRVAGVQRLNVRVAKGGLVNPKDSNSSPSTYVILLFKESQSQCFIMMHPYPYLTPRWAIPLTSQASLTTNL